MLIQAISGSIPFLTKSRGYYRSVILSFIDLQVIQCQCRLSKDVLKLFGGSWEELGELP